LRRKRAAAEALDVLKATPVDLILSDINMPLMGGLEFRRQLKAQNLAPDSLFDHMR